MGSEGIIKFEDVNSLDTKDIAEFRAFCHVGNNAHTFIRMTEDKKYYLHIVVSHKLQFVISTDKTNKNRAPQLKTFCELSSVFKILEKNEIEIAILDVCGKARIHMEDGGILINSRKSIKPSI
jgi:hypothetical protein